MLRQCRHTDLPNRLREALLACVSKLKDAGVDSPRLSAELLLAKAWGIERSELLKRLILNPATPVPGSVIACFAELFKRRAKGEPAAYILGSKEFYGRDFSVTPATLIPRPETELLVDLALAHGRALPAARPTAAFHAHALPAKADQPTPFLFADMGAGSGCIAVTLALELPAWQGLALDKSKAALQVAQKNAERLGAARVGFIRADFTKPPLFPSSLDMLISNPPYVSESEYQELSPEVRCFEPKSALVPAPLPQPARPGQPHGPLTAPAGAMPPPPSTGLEAADALIGLARTLLRPGGLLLMEIGHNQGQALLTRLHDTGWHGARVHKDLAGLDRVLAASRP